MTEKEKKEVYERANEFLNNSIYEEEMISIISSIMEHNLCYSINWCEKKELNLPPSKRKIRAGAGRVFVSKINDMVDYAGSSPFIDWVRYFELKIQGLEEYLIIEIIYKKEKMSALKTLLECNTPQLLRKINDDSKIIIEGRDYELERLKGYLDNAEIESEIQLKTRKNNNTLP